MSTVYNENQKPINAPGHGTTNGQGVSRYKNADMTEIDWFDTHPRPIEAVAPAGLPTAADLDAVAAEKQAKDATANSGADLSQV